MGSLTTSETLRNAERSAQADLQTIDSFADDSTVDTLNIFSEINDELHHYKPAGDHEDYGMSLEELSNDETYNFTNSNDTVIPIYFPSSDEEQVEIISEEKDEERIESDEDLPNFSEFMRQMRLQIQNNV